jgi:hypothetical protein
MSSDVITKKQFETYLGYFCMAILCFSAAAYGAKVIDFYANQDSIVCSADGQTCTLTDYNTAKTLFSGISMSIIMLLFNAFLLVILYIEPNMQHKWALYMMSLFSLIIGVGWYV